jgi:hypothetical protein
VREQLADWMKKIMDEKDFMKRRHEDDDARDLQKKK